MSRKLSAVLLAFVLISLTPAISIAANPTPAPPPQVKGEKKGGEQHPHIRAALHELQEARRELQTAAHDFGGHRKEALEAVDNAIKQLREALEYDKK
jgi:hypothetical protein